MKKISLIAILFSAVLLLQNCKKDIVTASTGSDIVFFALINDTTWRPNNLTAAINYDPATKIKIFSCSGANTTQEISFSIKQIGAPASNGFPIGTYTTDAASNISMSYYTLQPNGTGGNSFLPKGTVSPGSGTINISAIDSVKKVITGTFYFNSVKNNYDGSGNIVSVSVSNISQGAFNKMPYTLTNSSN